MPSWRRICLRIASDLLAELLPISGGAAHTTIRNQTFAVAEQIIAHVWEKAAISEATQTARALTLQLDHTYIRAAQSESTRHLQVLTGEIHALAEGSCHLASWKLTGGQTHDVTPAEALLDGVQAHIVVADKAYDADSLVERITASEAEVVIPPRSNRQFQRAYDRHLYKNRNVLERIFQPTQTVPSHRYAL